MTDSPRTFLTRIMPSTAIEGLGFSPRLCLADCYVRLLAAMVRIAENDREREAIAVLGDDVAVFLHAHAYVYDDVTVDLGCEPQQGDEAVHKRLCDMVPRLREVTPADDGHGVWLAAQHLASGKLPEIPTLH